MLYSSITVGDGRFEGSSHAVVQSDGKIVIAGSSFNTGGSDLNLVRLSADGVLDNTFGSNGVVTTDVGGNSDDATCIALQSDSKILVGGNAFPAVGNAADFTLSRYLSGLELGVLDFSIEDNGLLVYPNPIQESAVLEYTLTDYETINIDLYDISGSLVQSLVKSEKRAKGLHKERLLIDATISSGSYILTISNGKGSLSVKVVK